MGRTSSFGDALDLALITGRTVGYRDIFPETLAGRAASILAALLGLVIAGIYVALAANAVHRSMADNHPERMAGMMSDRGDSRRGGQER